MGDLFASELSLVSNNDEEADLGMCLKGLAVFNESLPFFR
jgi:hypothetical protein